MKLLSKLFITLTAMTAATGVNASENLVSLVDETLTYDVIYKWGFINKVAGYATMSLKNDGPLLKASVFARNAPWANSIYMLRDTLYTTMTRGNFYPVEYTLIQHEAGKYKKDVLTFTHTGDEFDVKAVRYKKSPTSAMTTSTINLSGKGMAVDMLSSFFYLRSLDFASMPLKHTTTVNIFSGSKKELLSITYLGKQTLSWNGENLETYYVNFTFTRNGVQSSDPIEGWITTDPRRIPLKVEGSLAIGKVRAIYTGPNQ